jgi:cobaltochelatase CobN
MAIVLLGFDPQYKAFRKVFEKAGIALECVSAEAMGDKESAAQARSLLEGSGSALIYPTDDMPVAVKAFMDSLSGEERRIAVGQAPPLSSGETRIGAAIEAYLLYAGEENLESAAKILLRDGFSISTGEIPPPAKKALEGIWDWETGEIFPSLHAYLASAGYKGDPVCGVMTHRANIFSGNVGVLRTLALSLKGQGITAAIAFSDAREDAFDSLVELYFSLDGNLAIDYLINQHMFVFKAGEHSSAMKRADRAYSELGIPAAHPIVSYFLDKKGWEESLVPVSADMASALSIPELGGHIEPIIIGASSPEGGSEPFADRAELLARRAASRIRLRKKPNGEKRLALMLHNSVCNGVEATIGKAFGLDAFESVASLLKRLKAEGYDVGSPPENGQALLDEIMSRKAYSDFRWTAAEDIVEAGGALYQMGAGEYEELAKDVPLGPRARQIETYGQAPGEGMAIDGKIVITGVQYGNALVMVQPKRGCYGAKCTGEVCKILHDPSCPPPHQYLATYRYIQRVWGADALIEVGTDGSSEYLPGKSNGLSSSCWPSIVIDDLPLFYFYNAGVANEALMAKRRLNAVIVDYLPPAIRRDPALIELAEDIGEYFNALDQNNSQDKELLARIQELAKTNETASRMLSRAPDTSTALREIGDALRSAAEGPLSAKRHVLGTVSEEEIESFVAVASEARGEAFDREAIRVEGELDNAALALSGRHVPAGAAGMPDESGESPLPTGRNIYGMDTGKIPTATAWARGVEMGRQLLAAYEKDEGRLPEMIAFDMMSLDVTRTNGEQLSEILWLLGVEPVWDPSMSVTGIRLIEPAALGRPRIDVTVRITGVMRDTWPMAVDMLDNAVLLAASAEEGDEGNFVAKHARGEADRLGSEGARLIRIFGDPPGAYGTGLNLALLASAWENEGDLTAYFVDNSAFAYGGNLNGRKAPKEFAAAASKVEATSDAMPSRWESLLSSSFSVEVHGGFALLSEKLSGKKPRSYQTANEPGKKIVTASLRDSMDKTLQNSLMNDFWLDGAKASGYDGASDIMKMVQAAFNAQCLAEIFDGKTLDALAERIILDEEMASWFAQTNPFASEEISRRLLELASRNKWVPSPETMEKLILARALIEGELEDRAGSSGADVQGAETEIVTWRDVAGFADKIGEIGGMLEKARAEHSQAAPE